MKIRGTEGMGAAEFNMELQRGARFVVYQYCISVLLLTFRRSSDIFFVKSTESAGAKGLPYTLLTLLLGWWGIPWGPIYTVQSLITNSRGGKDVTQEVLASLQGPPPQA